MAGMEMGLWPLSCPITHQGHRVATKKSPPALHRSAGGLRFALCGHTGFYAPHKPKQSRAELVFHVTLSDSLSPGFGDTARREASEAEQLPSGRVLIHGS